MIVWPVIKSVLDDKLSRSADNNDGDDAVADENDMVEDDGDDIIDRER